MEKEELEILKKLEATNRNLAKATWKASSVWWNLLRGIMYGFGVFLGTALLTALFIYILSLVEGWAFIGRYARDILNIINGKK